MKSKKLAALGLTAVLSLGLLTACSGGSDDTNETPAGSTPPVTESGAPAADSPANWTSVADLEGAKSPFRRAPPAMMWPLPSPMPRSAPLRPWLSAAWS